MKMKMFDFKLAGEDKRACLSWGLPMANGHRWLITSLDTPIVVSGPTKSAAMATFLEAVK